jgi:hypothetical protein
MKTRWQKLHRGHSPLVPRAPRTAAACRWCGKSLHDHGGKRLEECLLKLREAEAAERDAAERGGPCPIA